MQRLDAADRFFAATGAEIRHGGNRAYYAEGPDYVQMPPFETFRDAESHAATLALGIGPNMASAWRATLVANVLATKAPHARNWSPSLAPPSFVPTSALRRKSARITPLISSRGSRF
jgi:antirestriction protein ArdC